MRAIHLLREWVEDYPYGSPADETIELLDEIADWKRERREHPRNEGEEERERMMVSYDPGPDNDEWWEWFRKDRELFNRDREEYCRRWNERLSSDLENPERVIGYTLNGPDYVFWPGCEPTEELRQKAINTLLKVANTPEGKVLEKRFSMYMERGTVAEAISVLRAVKIPQKEMGDNSDG